MNQPRITAQDDFRKALQSAKDGQLVLMPQDCDFFTPLAPLQGFKWNEACNSLLNNIHQNLMWC